jgi:hypothetical protein
MLTMAKAAIRHAVAQSRKRLFAVHAIDELMTIRAVFISR